jgi:hypothetical protein
VVIDELAGGIKPRSRETQKLWAVLETVDFMDQGNIKKNHRLDSWIRIIES